MSQKYWYTRAWAQGSEKEKEKQQNFTIDCQKTCAKKKEKASQKETLQAGFFAGAKWWRSAAI